MFTTFNVSKHFIGITVQTIAEFAFIDHRRVGNLFFVNELETNFKDWIIGFVNYLHKSWLLLIRDVLIG